MASVEDPDFKKRSIVSDDAPPSPFKRKSTMPLLDDKKIDPSMLQFQNQKLSQQLEVQKIEIHELEDKFSELQTKQANYDKTLMIVNRAWKQLILDLELIASREGVSVDFSASLKDNGACKSSPEQSFLHALLNSNGDSEMCGQDIENALAAKRKDTVNVLTPIVHSILTQKQKSDELDALLRTSVPESESTRLLLDSEERMKKELTQKELLIDKVQIQLRETMVENAKLVDQKLKDDNEIQNLKNQLDDALSEVDSQRRKLAAMKQKESSQGGPTSNPHNFGPDRASNGVPSNSQTPSGTPKSTAALEESQKLAARRLLELEEAHNLQVQLKQKILRLEVELSDNARIHTVRHVAVLSEQVVLLRNEVDRYRVALEQVQRDRDLGILREKELMFKLEDGDAAKRACVTADIRCQDLEHKLKECILERDAMEQRLEESENYPGQKETVAELKLMVSTLRIQIGTLLEAYNKLKESANEVHTLRAETLSLSSILERKSRELEELQRKGASQTAEIKTLKDEVKCLRESEQELKLFLDMFERESTDSRDVMEAVAAERRALVQVERLKAALEEHCLTQKLNAANEAEALTQQKLVRAELDMALLLEKLDALERSNFELKEQIQSKAEERETFLSEIDTIGQAYEDMQSQNRRLLQQIFERDDYNAKLLSEGVKAKQQQTALLAEKDALASQMQNLTAVCEVHKMRVGRLEEQIKSYLDQLAKTSDDLRQQAVAAELARHKQQEAEYEAQMAKMAIDSAQKELDDRVKRIADADADLEKERFKRKRLEEELDVKSGRSSKGGSDRLPSMDKLQEELKEYKSMLRCSVCDDRRKEVVITKCFHAFCGPCIQRTLEIRHRKCPGCGTAFGQNDVKTVYL